MIIDTIITPKPTPSFLPIVRFLNILHLLFNVFVGYKPFKINN
jgi:hypothetical protein